MARLKVSSALFGAALWILGLVLAGPASAHHSVLAVYDVNKTMTVSGTVAKVEWISPHSFITVNVKDADGNVKKWAFETGYGALRKAGMSRADRGGIKPGDEIVISAAPAKDGSTNGFLRELKLGDGRVFKFGVDENGN